MVCPSFIGGGRSRHLFIVALCLKGAVFYPNRCQSVLAPPSILRIEHSIQTGKPSCEKRQFCIVPLRWLLMVRDEGSRANLPPPTTPNPNHPPSLDSRVQKRGLELASSLTGMINNKSHHASVTPGLWKVEGEAGNGGKGAFPSFSSLGMTVRGNNAARIFFFSCPNSQ